MLAQIGSELLTIWFPPVRENYLLSVVSKYYVPYQSDGRIGLSAA